MTSRARKTYDPTCYPRTRRRKARWYSRRALTRKEFGPNLAARDIQRKGKTIQHQNRSRPDHRDPRQRGA